MADDEVGIGDWLQQDPSDPDTVAARYDGWVATYDADLAAWDYRAPQTVTDLLFGGLPAVAAVLDVGCGTGLVGQTLRARGFAGELRGLDLSQASLDAAAAHGWYDALTQADLQQRLPADDASADAVVCVGVMTYLPQVEPVWREFARVVRPGGLVIATQREDLWSERDCPGVIERLERDGVWSVEQTLGPAPYLPDGYGGTDPVACYYLVARIR